MMFTHFGVTGPMILSASAHIGAKLAKAPNGELSAYLDLKPALPENTLDARILREFEAGPNKQFEERDWRTFPIISDSGNAGTGWNPRREENPRHLQRRTPALH